VLLVVEGHRTKIENKETDKIQKTTARHQKTVKEN